MFPSYIFRLLFSRVCSGLDDVPFFVKPPSCFWEESDPFLGVDLVDLAFGQEIIGKVIVCWPLPLVLPSLSAPYT